MADKKEGFFSRRTRRLRDKAAKVVGVEGIKEGRDAIVGMGEHLANIRKGRRGGKQPRNETFGNAYQRLRLDESQLAQNHRYHMGRFYIFALFFALALGFFLFAILRGTLLSLGPSLGAVLLFGALAFQASFRLLQIERRELIPVQEWVRSPGSWIPAPFTPRVERGEKPQPGRDIARKTR